MICVHFRFASLVLNSSCSRVDFSPARTPSANTNRSICVHELLFCSFRLLSSFSRPPPHPPPPAAFSLSPSLSSSRELWCGGFGRLRYAPPARHGIRRSELLNFTCEISPGSFFHNLGHIPQITRCLKLRQFVLFLDQRAAGFKFCAWLCNTPIYIFISVWFELQSDRSREG